METASESAEPIGDNSLALPPFNELELASPTHAAVVDEPVPVRIAPWVRRRARVGLRLSVAARQELMWIVVIYMAARLVLLLAAFIQASFGHHPFQNELANWDGLWYREVANKGYPSHVSYLQTTLGFFPLYPLTIWPLEHVLGLFYPNHLILCATIAGAIISGVGGLVATVLVHRITDGWWGRAVARRATIIFVLFPGAVVFSMVYTEGLLLSLAIGCIYALERRRWLLAGILAGLATAVQPVGLVLVPVCLISALLEIHRRGWRVRDAYRSLVAPVLSVTGAVGFMLFLWLWTGNPFASYIAQHHGWSESTTPLALLHLTTRLANELSFNHFDQPTINLNLVIGLLGAVFLVVLLVLLWFCRREVSIEALVWTAGISFLAFTSSEVPPNPRMLITAFPALVVIARFAAGKWFRVIAWINGGLLIFLSLLTFYGLTLRP
ncbi:MAG TPA: mannosyltransferase family protein [Solirubrobacteraceae bacterium]|nr:mannosyltransferase family protein [Solirubrobacteraceae bacterium]